VYAFDVPAHVANALRLLEHIETKAGHATRLIGAAPAASALDSSVGPGPSAPALATQLRECLERWRSLDHTSPRRVARDGAADAPKLSFAGGVSLLDAVHWLALVRVQGSFRLLAQSGTGATDGIADVAAMVARIDASTRASGRRAASMRDADTGAGARRARSAVSVRRLLDDVARGVRSWHDAQAVRAEAGSARDSSPAVHRAIEARVHALLASAPALHRPKLRVPADAALRMLRASRGAAAESALDAWFGLRDGLSPREWLVAWRELPVLAAVRAQARDDEPVITSRREGDFRPAECRLCAVIVSDAGGHAPDALVP